MELRRHLSGQFRLERGDKIRTADGSSGIVLAVVNVVQARVMYNLEVAGNHDFFVGEGEWLVHNCPHGDDDDWFKEAFAQADEQPHPDYVSRVQHPNFVPNNPDNVIGAASRGEIQYNPNGHMRERLSDRFGGGVSIRQLDKAIQNGNWTYQSSDMSIGRIQGYLVDVGIGGKNATILISRVGGQFTYHTIMK